jgi:hypothetical protein
MVVYSSLAYSVLASLNPYLEFSTVNWRVGLSEVNGKNKDKNYMKIFQSEGFCCRMK